jgi:lipoprotein NlpI
MIKPLLLSVLVAALMLQTGCSSVKKSRPKESSALATEVEETFRHRWVDKRVSELTAQGVAADAARTQADTEFRERYPFNAHEKK